MKENRFRINRWTLGVLDNEGNQRNSTYNETDTVAVVRDSILALIILIFVYMAGYPRYNVWKQTLVGEAKLKRAEQERQIAVHAAQAKLDSASLLAQAEVERAKGVEESNRIIAGGLGGAEGYLRYLYINSIGEHAGKDGTIIYVATEAGLPILEANRLGSK